MTVNFSTALEAKNYYKDIEQFRKQFPVECYLLKLSRYQNFGNGPVTERHFRQRNMIIELMLDGTSGYQSLKNAVEASLTAYDTFRNKGDTCGALYNDHYEEISKDAEEPSANELQGWYFSNIDISVATVMNETMYGTNVYNSAVPCVDNVLRHGLAVHMEKVFKHLNMPVEMIINKLTGLMILTEYNKLSDDQHDLACTLDDLNVRIKRFITQLGGSC